MLQLVCKSEDDEKVIYLRPADLDATAMDPKILKVLDSNHGITDAMLKKCLQTKKYVCVYVVLYGHRVNLLHVHHVLLHDMSVS